MSIILIAIAVVLGAVLLISADAGQVVGLSQTQTSQALPLVILLVVIAAGVFARQRRVGEAVRNLALWAGIFAVALVGYAYRDDFQNVANRVFGELMPGVAIVDVKNNTATFRRGRGGHFQVNSTINGASVPLIFDTGASAMVLTAEDAQAVGIDPQRLNYNVMVSTANGTGRAASVILDRVDVGGIVRNGVRAYVAEPGALDMSLLGMTFLETLNHYTVTSNSLELAG